MNWEHFGCGAFVLYSFVKGRRKILLWFSFNFLPLWCNLWAFLRSSPRLEWSKSWIDYSIFESKTATDDILMRIVFILSAFETSFWKSFQWCSACDYQLLHSAQKFRFAGKAARENDIISKHHHSSNRPAHWDHIRPIEWIFQQEYPSKCFMEIQVANPNV